MRFQPEGGERAAHQPLDTTLRLIQAEHPKEVFPLLVKELIACGYPRAAVLEIDVRSGELRPVASQKFSRHQMKEVSAALRRRQPALASMLHGPRSAVLPMTAIHNRPVYIHPIPHSASSECREADHAAAKGSSAEHNLPIGEGIGGEDGICPTCGRHDLVGVVVVELQQSNGEDGLAALGGLIEAATRYRSRLVKIEHDRERMHGMEIAIAQMGTVMQSMADPVILTDHQNHVIMQNAAAQRFFKVPDEMSEGMGRAVELNNLLFSAALSSMLVSGGGSYRDLTLVDSVEGEETLFEAVAASTYGPDGRRIGTVTVMRDVTDLRRADQELRDNYEKLRQAEESARQERNRLNLVIENVGDPIVVCDREGRLVLEDPLAEELFGLVQEAHRRPAQLRNQAALNAHLASFNDEVADRGTASLRLYHPSLKQEIEYDARSGKIFDENGQVSFIVTVLRDLTALRRVEQLKVERRMLEIEKFAAAGRLAATIAHEVNNPMEAIKNAVYLLSNSVPEEAQPVYGILKSETERVARIVRQMLGLYRNTEQVRPANINTLLEDTLMLLSRQLKRVNVEVICDLRPLPEAVIAADQVRQIFSNLVINARDAMPNGGKLRVRTRHVPGRDGPQGWVRVLIADSGTGIPAEMIRAIFEPFVTTKGEKGTGLGLWIVKGILQNHGGRLSVRSKVGAGTVFKIDFPVVKP